MLNNLVALFDSGVAAPNNSFESIQTYTVGAGGQSTISFTSIPSTYKHLQIRALSRTTSGTFNDMKLSFNGSTGTNYSWHRIIADGSSASAGGGGSTTLTTVGLNTGSTQTSGVFAANIIDILDYGNTNKNKTVRALVGADNNGSGYVIAYSGAWYDTAAISQIDITASAGNFAQYSHFALYGIKG